jgi:hypothetical protein
MKGMTHGAWCIPLAGVDGARLDLHGSILLRPHICIYWHHHNIGSLSCSAQAVDSARHFPNRR